MTVEAATAVSGMVARSSVVMALALVASLMLRRRSAAHRHGVVAAGLLGAVLVPGLSFGLPEWYVIDVVAWASDAVHAPVEPEDVAVAAAGHRGEESHPTGGVAARRRVASGVDPGVVHSGSAGVRALLLGVFAWGLGTAGALSALVIALVRLARTTARARPVDERIWLDTVAQLERAHRGRRRTALLHADDIAGVATWGFVRPRILLPSAALSWPESRVHAVLCHELAHVRRADWAIQTCAEVAWTVCWFNPLFWYTCTKLRREAEHACDDCVLRAGVSPSDYAAHLVSIVRTARRAPGWAPVTPVARPSTLEGRITAMLTPFLDRRPLSRRARLALVVALFTVAVSAAVVRLGAQGTPLSVEGAVFDTSGGVLPGATVTLEDAQQVKWPSATDRTGRFEFTPLSPGEYVLEASLPGFRSLRQAITLSPGRSREQTITLQVGSLEETISVTARRPSPRAGAASSGSTPRVRVGGNIKQPRKLEHVAPVYPESLRAAGLEGTVPMDAVIDVAGAVASVRIASAQVHPEFAAAAAEAVKQWRFSPTLLNGVAVDVQMSVSVRFSLTD